MSLDLVIRNGTVYDGTGGEPIHGDVAIEGGRIVAVGTVDAADAPELDAAGLAVAPGFIDIHSHSDYTLLVDPRAASAIHQGVTLEVVGNCGFGCFPIVDPVLARKAIYGYSDDVPIEWSTAGGYFDRLERGAARGQRAEPRPERPAAPRHRRPRRPRRRRAPSSARMRELLRESLGEGAWGYSTGLEYAQESGAPEEEITALCSRARRAALRDAHAPARRGPVRVGRGGDPHRRARRGAPAGLAPRAAQRDRGEPPLDRARRARPRPRPRRRVRHAHAPLRDHAPLRRAAAVGARRGRPRRAARRPRRARPDAPAPQHPQRRERLVAHRRSSTTRSGPSTPAATSPRSRPSAARSRSTPSTTCSCRRSRSRTS